VRFRAPILAPHLGGQKPDGVKKIRPRAKEMSERITVKNVALRETKLYEALTGAYY
jgi:hypothetical protein